MKILCSAQSFGYGPCSKLISFVKHLRKIYRNNLKIDFIGDDIALIYALQNREYFHKIFKYQGEYPNPEDYEIIISVMNPHIAIWGWFNKKRVLYIDSLFWFWQWEKKNFEYIEKIIYELNYTENFNKVRPILKKIDSHYLQYIAHRVSSLSCIQKFFDQKNKGFTNPFRKNISNLVEVGPIIDISFKEKENKRNKILISCGGLYSPLIRLKEGVRYVNFILNLLDEFIKLLPRNIEITLTTNPEIVSNVSPSNRRLNIISLNNKQFLRALNKTIVLFTPPSITTIYEALFYNVPIIFLPEQHDGHFPNFLKLSSNKIQLPNLRKIFPELLFNTRIKLTSKKNPDEKILQIQQLIEKFSLSFDNPIILDMKNTLKKCLTLIIDDKKRGESLHQQQRTVLKKLKVLDTKTVESVIKKLLH